MSKQNKLTFTKMVNKAGKTVAPTSEAFQAAAANPELEVATRVRRRPFWPINLATNHRR